MFLFEFINWKMNIPNFKDDWLSIINFILVRKTKFLNIFCNGKIVGTKCPPLNISLRQNNSYRNENNETEFNRKIGKELESPR